MTPPGLQTYQQTSVRTADRRKIVTLLYEGAIRNLHLAIHAIESGDTRTRTDKVLATLDIIQFLTAALDMDKGGEIARNLERLYDFARDSINMGNIQGDVSRLRAAIDVFTVILDGWRQATEGPEQAPVAAQPPARTETLPQPAASPEESEQVPPAPAPVIVETPQTAPRRHRGYAASPAGPRTRAVVG